MVHFTKMHGLGNDYIYVNTDQYPIEDLPAFAKKYSDRRMGIGGDGVVTYAKDANGLYRMRIFNIDGSEGLMCGNAIRCVAKLLYERGLDKRNPLQIETASGCKELWLTLEQDEVQEVRVDMGRPTIVEEDLTIAVEGAIYRGTHVEVGNPHYVTFIDQAPKDYPLETYGPMVEQHPHFPNRVNFEIAQVCSEGEIQMRVYERGSGLTLACGTGACATAVAAIHAGRAKSPTRISMPGGTLTIEWNKQEGGNVFMTGPATVVYEGVLPVK